MMSGATSNPLRSKDSFVVERALRRLLRLGLISLMVIVLIGCATLQTGVSALPEGSVETQVALQVARLEATAAAAAPDQPTKLVQPTYTPLPTYTPYPTFTRLPTYTPVPSFTPPGMSVPIETSIVPTQTPLTSLAGAHPYTLRVRNMFRSTYWIGTYSPYGGNFIKPYWYVEFYPPEPMEMRIFFCRYTGYFYNHWRDIDFDYDYDDLDYANNWDGCRKWDYFNYWWDRGGLYNCNYLDFEVDGPLVEVQVP